LISVAACAGDASAAAASATDCNNLKASFTDQPLCSAAARDKSVRCAVLNLRGGGFNATFNPSLV
jgi:hypothetical protein